MASPSKNDSDSDQNNPGSAFDDYYRQFGDDPYPSQTQYNKEFGDRDEEPYPSQTSYDNDFGGDGADSEELEAAESDSDEEVAADAEADAVSQIAASGEEEKFKYTGKAGGDGNWFSKMKGRKRLFFLLFPVLSLMFMLLISGPLKLIQIGKMFENFHMGPNRTSQNSRVGRLIEHYRTGNDPSKRNIGYLAEKLSGKQQNDLKKKGIEIKYDEPNGSGKKSRRMQSMEIDTSTPEGKRTLAGLKDKGFKINESGAKAIVNFNEGPDGKVVSARLRRKALDLSIDSMGKSKVTSAISKRLLRTRAGVDFHPIKNKRRDLNESYKSWKDKRKKERAERNTRGVDPDGGRTISGDSDTDPDTGDVTPDPDTTGAADASNGLVGEAKNADTPALKKSLAGRLAGGTAAAIGVLCMMRDIGNEIPKYQHANTVLPAVRAGMELVAVGSQVQASFQGNAPLPSLDDMRMFSELVDGVPLPESSTPVVASLFTSKAMAADEPSLREVASSKPLMNALSIERQNGVATGGQPLPPDIDIGSSVNDKPALFDFIDDIPTLGTICGTINSATSFLKKIPGVGSLVQAAEDLQSEAIDFALNRFGTSMEELMLGVVAWLSGDALELADAAGSLLGGVADLGVFLGEKEVGNSLGAGEVTQTQLQALKQDAWEMDQFAQSNKSLFAKTIDFRDSNSLLAQAIVRTPSFNGGLTVAQNTASLFSSLTSNVKSLGSVFSPKAKAAAPIAYDYGVKASAFTLEELESEITEDPSANADIVEPQLAALNEKYSGCFGTTVDPTTFALRFESSPDYSKTGAEKCWDGSETLLRYRIYLLDTVTFRALDCYDNNDQQSCEEMGIEGGGSSSSSTGGTAGDFAVGIEVLNCEGYKKISGDRANIVNGVPTNVVLVPYSDSIKQDCQNFKTQCVNGAAGTIKALCAAFEFDDVYYGNGYSGNTPKVYGFDIGTIALYGPTRWFENRQPGLNPNNLLECSALTTVAIYKGFGYKDTPGTSGNWGSRSYPELFKDVSISEVAPGDFLTKTRGGSGHIAIAAGPIRPDGKVLVYHTNATGSTAHFQLQDYNSNFGDGYRSRWIGPGL